MPVHTHSGPAPHEDYGTGEGCSGIYATETVWWTARPMWFLLWSGVFERFPGLKFAVTEARVLLGGRHAVDAGTRCTTATTARGSSATPRARNLTMLPSEYFDRNVQDRLVEHASP